MVMMKKGRTNNLKRKEKKGGRRRARKKSVRQGGREICRKGLLYDKKPYM